MPKLVLDYLVGAMVEPVCGVAVLTAKLVVITVSLLKVQ